MSRPQRRERRRRLQKLTRKTDSVIAADAARKARKAVDRLKAVLVQRTISVKSDARFLFRSGHVVPNKDYIPDAKRLKEGKPLNAPSFDLAIPRTKNGGLAVTLGKVTGSSGRLAPDNIATMASVNPGSLDGKITVKGFRTEEQRGFKLSVNERLVIGLQKLTLVAVLEAAYDGLPPDLESRKAWLQVEGFHWIRWAGYEPYIYGYDRNRSIRAQNSGSGKPKRKPRRKTWQESKDPPQVEYRLLGKDAKGKVFQETGKLDGKVLRERPSRK